MTDTDKETTHAEEIHLPGPSLLPFLVALGVSLLLVGLTTSMPLLVIGAAITLLAIAKWIKLARAEFNELPPTH